MKKIIIAIVIILIPIILISGLYLFSWKNSVSLSLASSLNLPVAKVNKTTVPLKIYLKDLQAANLSSELKDISASDKRLMVWQKILQEQIIMELLPSDKRKFDQAELKDLEAGLLRSIGMEVLNEAELKKSYGYSKNDFLERVVKPLYLQQQLLKHYILDVQNPAKQKVDAIYQKVSADPGQFDTELTSISTAEPVTQMVNVTQLVDNYAHLANLQIGEISSIVANPDGYRIYRVENIVGEGDERVFELLELFVPEEGFDAMVSEALQNAKVKFYIKNILK